MFFSNQAQLFVRAVRAREFPHAQYPFNLPVVRNLSEFALTSPVVFLVGENGAGKSTLLEAMAVGSGFNAEGGTKNFTFSTARTHSDLCDYITMIKGVRFPKNGFFLRAESFYNVATDIDRMDAEGSFDPPVKTYYGGISLHEQSHGESFLALMKNRFSGDGLYYLDEPEAALSPMRQLAVMRLIKDYVDDGAQFIISTHSPILMAFPGAQILTIDESGLHETRYEETEHYLITRDFLRNPKLMLEELFRD